MFYIYQKLEPAIKKIATSHWSYEVLRKVGAKNTNELPLKLNKGNSAIKIQKQGYWRKKWDGQPLKNSVKLDDIDNTYNGVSQTLYHPLWTLLSEREITKNKLAFLTQQLPLSIQSEILSTQKCFTLWHIKKIAKCNSLDSVAALLLIHLKQKNINAEYNDRALNMELFKLMLRLFSFPYAKVRYGYELCVRIGKYFKKPSDYKNIHTISLKKFPHYLHQINSVNKFTTCCRIYRDLSKKLHQCDKLKESEKSQLGYMSYIKHDRLNELNSELKYSKGVCSKECRTGLGKLRVSYYFGNSKGVYLLPDIRKFF